MKNLIVLALTSILFSSPAFAAKFTKISKMQSRAAQELSEVAAAIVRNKEAFGDAGSILRFSFERKESEQDLNTMKQLNRMKAGLTSDDSGASEGTGNSASDLASHLLEMAENTERENDLKRARASLTEALKSVKADRNLKIFVTNHADEDGSWQVLDVLDTRTNQVLFIKIGYYGT